MKKVMYNRFGGTEVLEMTEAPMPASDIVIKVKAVSLNPLDWKLRQGEMKLMSGRKFPKSVGIDFSGVVVQGKGKYRIGDEVFGIASIFKGGALAEYVAVDAENIFHKPLGSTFEEAAAMPVAGSAALQIFGKIVNVQPGMEVLINGAGGGIGLFAIQLAKKAGAVVTAAAGSAAMDIVTEMGSDFIIDYHKENVLKNGKSYDVIVDLSGKMNYRAAKTILKRSGVYVNTSPGVKEMIGSMFSNRYRLLFLKMSQAYLERLAAADLKVVIGERYDFSDFGTAYSAVQKNGVQGKAVITVS